MRKEIGKIQHVHFGMGGYQDAQIGVSFTLGSDKGSWGVGDFKGHWGIDHSAHCKWSEQDRLVSLGETVMYIRDLLRDAKVNDVNDLVGKPVEVTFENQTLKSWRLLTEVI